MAPENGARFLEPERFCCDSTVYMELQHHGFNGKLFDGLFFVVWLICMYRNVLLYQRETSTHKAANAKSVGAHVYFQVGSLECVPNGCMDYSYISLQSQTLAVVVFCCC